ncbi:MAG: aldehyde-activating protein [Gammaproteobacteria bacterium]|nr:aldehyde-activating protein [Gammaproteobacteria bacterium]MAY03125.1 aldehyde-activating protein [Gammaproteobacteria bacterium]|tara:strand:+ start:3758 stop:4105 length:348 start_codon:yes stop_codon:yes gene_type:complete
MKNYQGSCHCGSVTFSFEHEKINSGLKCNCSICKRKAATMSDFVIAPDELSRSGETLSFYQFGTNVAKHYFCNNCGIYVFHETLRMPGHFRVNLGCIDEIDTYELSVKVFDGASL